MAERKGASYKVTAKRPAHHHGEHTQQTQASDLFKVGGAYHAMSGITPEIEDTMSSDEWLRYNTRKFGHGGV